LDPTKIEFDLTYFHKEKSRIT